MIRDIVCFIPLIVTLPVFLGIEGILFAAPIADFIAMIVAAALTVAFFKTLMKNHSEEKPKTALKPSKKGVIVTISREHGSSGKQIGKLVAEKLGIPFYYKEMITLAAKESGLNREFISDIHKNSPDIMRDLYLSSNAVQYAIKAQDAIIREIAENGSCVIVGRAADYILKDYDNVVRIFIHAPQDYRIQRVMDVYGDTPKEARVNIERSDKARASYYEHISGTHWGDARNYELTVDSSDGVEKTAQFIVRYITGHTQTDSAV